MNEHRNFALRQRQVYRSRVETQFTDYALAGLRKSHYAGVFERIKDRDRPAWLAELKLDGFQRSLFVKLWSSRDRAGNIRRVGLLQGLSLKLEKRTFDLITIPETRDRFQGIVELQSDRLVINVFPATATGERKIYFCHLELVRSDGSIVG
ncbi:conserved hypothetical protein [Roseovarius sp. EC-HK134]|uniref:hypothetical protein n=1 Tax=unclassified Roseovarius TaxID=2614913 RepID=UPI001254E20C|nr:MULTISPECIES: hypothetical protein [unclassified Roseovarius]VVT33130.1 conserved hypothetical protein [Roseovarius sp. EC-SD190]VVT33161.1 conserved hypothetical protein [Roseovarius sp. EC-HK134]